MTTSPRVVACVEAAVPEPMPPPKILPFRPLPPMVTVVVLLLLPVVPLLIVAFIVICIMALTKGIRNKSLVQLLTMLVSVGFAVAVSMFSSSMSSDEDISTLMNNAGSLVEVYKKAFVTMPMAVDTLTKYSLKITRKGLRQV